MSYLTLDACQAAGAGLRLTEALTVTSTGLSGDSQSMKLPLLLSIYPLHSCSREERLPLSGGIRLQETSLLQLSITDVDVNVLT